MLRAVSLLVVFFVTLVRGHVDLTADPPEYGVDCSTPSHYGINKEECPYFYDRYNKMIQGCFKLYSKEECMQNERERLLMNIKQPPTQHNYTAIGFKKIKTPISAWKPIIDFYNANKQNKVLEKWYHGATIVNTWDSPTYMVSFENPSFRGGVSVKNEIWEAVRPTIEEWVGHKIRPTSLYGIRIYTDKAVLATHVDRLPLVSSCIVNVDQDLDEPWPVEVYDHSGKAYNITMEPGDMVLYESSTVLHGRPFPLKGRFYANAFIHYEPLDHAEQNERDEELRMLAGEPVSINRRHGRLRSSAKLPDEEAFREAAARGQLGEVKRLFEQNAALLKAEDENKWQATHEAARGGHLDVVQYLISKGADMAHRVNSGLTVLGVAKENLTPDHPVIKYLKTLEALR